MEITVKGDPKEIAALVVALQERQEEIVLDKDAIRFRLKNPDIKFGLDD